MLLSKFLLKRELTLSEHLTTSECGNSSIFSMSSECQFSPWYTETIEQSSTHWQLGWLVMKGAQLDLPLLRLLEGERAIRECGMLLHEEQSCDSGMIEAAMIVPRIEPGENSLQTAKSGSTGTEIPLNWVVVSNHNPDYIIMADKSLKTSMMRFALQDHMTMDYISYSHSHAEQIYPVRFQTGFAAFMGS